MQLVSLEVSNFMRIVEARIDFDKNGATISGDNEQGKSALLTAIKVALRGKGEAPEDVVRRGEKAAKISLDLGDLAITRDIDAKGKWKTKLKWADGKTRPGGTQSILDTFIDKVAFDPTKLERMKGRELAEEIRKIVPGLDFTDHDAKRDEKFKERTDVNRDLKAKTAELEACPYHKDAPAEEYSAAVLLDEVEANRERNAANHSKRKALDDLRASAIEIKNNIAAMTAKLDETIARGKEMAADVDKLKDLPVDDLVADAKAAEETNAKVRDNAKHATLSAEVTSLDEQADSLTSYMDQMDEVKKDAISSAEYPIEGLAVDGDVVTYQGNPLESESRARRLVVCTAIVMARNPKLNILLLEDGSRMDKKTRAEILEYAGEHGAQLVIEVVGADEECTVVIEDGEVRS